MLLKVPVFIGDQYSKEFLSPIILSLVVEQSPGDVGTKASVLPSSNEKPDLAENHPAIVR